MHGLGRKIYKKYEAMTRLNGGYNFKSAYN